MMLTGQWTKSSRSLTDSSCVEVQWQKSVEGFDMNADQWTKSSLSGHTQCVEVGVWAKSSKSGPHDDMCVEVAGAEEGDVLVRDTKDREGPVLRFTRAEFSAFVAGVKLGEFDVD